MWALAAAREAAGLDIRSRGMAGRDDLPPLRVYTSAEAHSSVEKACIALGLGQQGLHKVEVDGEFRMRPDALAAAVEADVAAGVRPIAVVPTVGTTSTTSVDPVGEVAEIAARHGMWVHVDAAYGGAAGLLPTHRAPARRMRARGLAGLQPAQVAADAGRLQPALHVTAGRAAAGVLGRALLPDQRRRRRRRT